MVFSGILLDARSTDLSSILTTLAPVLIVLAIVIVRQSNRARRRQTTAPKPLPFVYPTHPVIDPRPGSAAPARPLSPIDSVRQLMGPVPRAFDAGLGSYLTVVPPKFLVANPNDEMWLNVKNQDRARRNGPVVWATIVQANNNLFKQNNAESGASVIYSADPSFDRNPNILQVIARQCFALKGTDPPDPQSAAFSRMLTNEMTRGMRMKVPSVFTGGREVFHSAMLMPRKHLPKGYLAGSFFPVWIDPGNTGAVVMVPAAFWPASLTAEWDAE